MSATHAQTATGRVELRDAALFRFQAYVEGEWLDAETGAAFPVTNPATGEVLAHVPRMGVSETRRAIEAAERALPAWAKLLAKDRARFLRRLAELMLEHEDDLAVLMTLEQGKPLAESRAEVAYAASFFEWFGEEAKRVYGDTIPAPLPDRRVLVGAVAVGPEAGEWLGQLSLAVKAEVPIDVLRDTIQPYPTFSEAIFFAVRDLPL
jgi:succinate-semialdehyde dehydrogenase/glutarate-semialdehyde dehydrogenase